MDLIEFLMQSDYFSRRINMSSHLTVPMTPIIAFERLFFAVFGQTSPDDINALRHTRPEWTENLFKIVYGIYMLVSVIVLINLLIAMMSDTYQRIQVTKLILISLCFPCTLLPSNTQPVWTDNMSYLLNLLKSDQFSIIKSNLFPITTGNSPHESYNIIWTVVLRCVWSNDHWSDTGWQDQFPTHEDSTLLDRIFVQNSFRCLYVGVSCCPYQPPHCYDVRHLPENPGTISLHYLSSQLFYPIYPISV